MIISHKECAERVLKRGLSYNTKESSRRILAEVGLLKENDMARIMVDSDKKQNITEWGFTNKEGYEEYVFISEAHGVVGMNLDKSEEAFVFIQDIPNLIKALQAAYDSKQGEKI